MNSGSRGLNRQILSNTETTSVEYCIRIWLWLPLNIKRIVNDVLASQCAQNFYEATMLNR